MLGGGLGIILLALLAGLVVGVVTAAALGYALLTKNAPRGFAVGVASTAASVVAVVLSAPLWAVELRGTGTHGEAIHVPGQHDPILRIVILEGVVLVTAVFATIRQRLRMLREQAPAPANHEVAAPPGGDP